jgi:hypothetical protein
VVDGDQKTRELNIAHAVEFGRIACGIDWVLLPLMQQELEGFQDVRVEHGLPLWVITPIA